MFSFRRDKVGANIEKIKEKEKNIKTTDNKRRAAGCIWVWYRWYSYAYSGIQSVRFGLLLMRCCLFYTTFVAFLGKWKEAISERVTCKQFIQSVTNSVMTKEGQSTPYAILAWTSLLVINSHLCFVLLCIRNHRDLCIKKSLESICLNFSSKFQKILIVVIIVPLCVDTETLFCQLNANSVAYGIGVGGTRMSIRRTAASLTQRMYAFSYRNPSEKL